MNKEDLIFQLKKRCSFWLNNKTISKKHALECLWGILENEESQPSLPSDIDEAAGIIVARLVPTLGQKNEDGSYVKGTRDYFSRDELIGLVKAGAELVTGQGVSMSGKVGIYGIDVESITEELRDAGFRLGEEVILQIRKKR